MKLRVIQGGCRTSEGIRRLREAKPGVLRLESSRHIDILLDFMRDKQDEWWKVCKIAFRQYKKTRNPAMLGHAAVAIEKCTKLVEEQEKLWIRKSELLDKEGQ